MKKLLICLGLLTGFALSAQYRYPAFSPFHKTVQMIGYTTVTIECNRPIARGRQIFGGLVPYDSLWLPGASGTTITFDQAVTVAGFAVPAGAYAMQVFPRPTEWTFVLSTAENGIGIYDPKFDVVNVCVPVQKPGRFHESYTVEMDLRPGEATLYLTWTDVQIAVPIATDAETRAVAFIDSLAAAPLTKDVAEYSRAANYLTFNGKSLDTALRFIGHLIELEPDEYFYYEMRVKALLKLKRKRDALVALDEALSALERKHPDDPIGTSWTRGRLARLRGEIETL